MLDTYHVADQKTNYRTRAIKTCFLFETALDYKPRILRSRKVSFNTNRSAVKTAAFSLQFSIDLKTALYFFHFHIRRKKKITAITLNKAEISVDRQ